MIRKLPTLFICVCLLANYAYAKHIKGGYMYYVCTGPSVSDPSKLHYQLYLKLYRDCVQASSGQNPTSVNFTIFETATNQRVTSVSGPQTGEYYLQKGSFSECISPAPAICYVVLEYAGSVDLTPIAGGYTLSFQRCCRIDGIVNIQAPSNAEGITYTITIPGTVNGINNPNNSSPLFAQKDTAVTCYRSNFVLDYSATDPDGDSLVYAFTGALRGGNSNNPSPTDATAPPYSSVPYSGGYSADNPFGTNININSATGIITGVTPGTPGEYVLAVSIKEYRNGKYIAETRKELHVVVAGCTIVEAVLPPKIISCDDFSVTFENGSQSPNIRTYHWDFGVPGITNDTSTIANPTYIYPDTGTFTAKLIVNKFENCSDSATTRVIVYPGFKPGFTVFGSCVTNPFQFRDTTRSRYGAVNKWLWDFGEPTASDDVSGLQNASYLYPAIGSKTVTFTVSDSKGCEAKVEKLLEVLEKPLLNLAFKDTLICSIDTLQLQAGGSGTFVWTPNFRIINRNTATPLVYPQDTITYYVTVTDNGCVNTDSVRINVLDSITVDAGPNLTICRTDGVTLSAISHGLQYLWSPAATLDNPQKKFPVATPLAPQTTYQVTAILGGCTAQDNVTVKTIPYPVANAGPDTTLCFNTAGTLRGSIIASSFNWSPRNLVTNPTSLTTGVKPVFSTNFVLTVFDTLGCPKPSRDTVLVRVLPRLNVFAGNDTAVIVGQPLLFGLPEVPPAIRYHWSPGIGISNADSLNPVFLFTNTTSLPEGDSIRYRLIATTAIGCTGSDEVLVKVFKTGPSIFVPGGFTPNGDGNNDVLKPILVGMKTLNYFRIYNRPGQLIFSTTSQNNGWDGSINGNLQGSAAYVYHAQAVDYTGKVVNQSGTVLLIR